MKKNTVVAIIVLALLSCKEQPQTKVATTKNQELVKQYFDHFNNHDFTKMANMYADTADFKDPTLGDGIVKQTRQQTIAKYTELAKIFTDLHDEVINVYPAGEKHIVVEFISSGTAPDQTKFKLPICTIFTIENGVITKDYTYFDNFEEVKQKN